MNTKKIIGYLLIFMMLFNIPVYATDKVVPGTLKKLTGVSSAVSCVLTNDTRKTDGKCKTSLSGHRQCLYYTAQNCEKDGSTCTSSYCNDYCKDQTDNCNDFGIWDEDDNIDVGEECKCIERESYFDLTEEKTVTKYSGNDVSLKFGDVNVSDLSYTRIKKYDTSECTVELDIYDGKQAWSTTTDTVDFNDKNGNEEISCHDNKGKIYSIDNENDKDTCDAESSKAYNRIWASTVSQIKSEETYNANSNIINTNGKTCIVEGKQAKIDNEVFDNAGDEVSLNSQVKGVFEINNNTDTKYWCNLNKYRGDDPYNIDYDYENDAIVKLNCNKYKYENSEITSGNEDLLKGLEINIPGDKSGIQSVKVELGICSYIYEADTSKLEEIVKTEDHDDGVKDKYTNGFTIRYDNDIFGNSGLDHGIENESSLKVAFGKERLDECLDNGENYLIVTVTDMARSSVDGVSPDSNVEPFDFGPILIDNGNPKIDITDDLLNAESENYASSGEGFREWMNRTLKGNMTYSDSGDGPRGKECKNFAEAGTGTCVSLKPLPNQGGKEIYVGPAGVDAETGIFNKFKCGNTGHEITFPVADEDCRIGCKDHYIYDSINNKCNDPGGLCINKIQGGVEYEGAIAFPAEWNSINHGYVEDHIIVGDSGDECLPFCSPGHTMGCIVKE